MEQKMIEAFKKGLDKVNHMFVEGDLSVFELLALHELSSAQLKHIEDKLSDEELKALDELRTDLRAVMKEMPLEEVRKRGFKV